MIAAIYARKWTEHNGGTGYGRAGRLPCLEQPCARPAGARSGLCRTHYRALWLRTRRFRRLVGTELAIAGVRVGLDQVQPETLLGGASLEAVRRLVDGILAGKLLVVRNAHGRARRGRAEAAKR
jgi:hypothetical protein